MTSELRSPQGRLDIALVAVDLDGTLLNEASQVGDFTAACVQKLVDQGIVFALATGRLPSRLPPSVLNLPGLTYGVFCNGGSVRHLHSGAVIACEPIPTASLIRVQALLAQTPIYYELYAEGFPYTDSQAIRYYSDAFYSPGKLPAMRQAKRVLAPEALQTLAAQAPVEKIFMPYLPADLAAMLQAKLADWPGLSLVQSDPTNLEVNAQTCSKAKGVAQLAAHLGISPEAVLVFGDAGNDLDMLAAFKYSVAMGQASAEIKAAARYVTDSCAQEGVGVFLQRYVLEADR